MTYSLIWLPEVLRKAGLKVAETEGWASRGAGDMGTVRGVMCHHTGSLGSGNMPTLNMLMNGRGGDHPLPGPLAQLGLARDGTFYVVAAGRANHAGRGEWKGVKTGNSSFIGIEAENAGTPDARWPDWQMDAYRRGVAAILRRIGADADMCCGHKEYALPRGRKPDPLFDMNVFRNGVRDILLGQGAVRPLVPALEPVKGRPTLQRGDRGPDVERVQMLLKLETDCRFGPNTETAVRAFQLENGLRPDGVIGPKTWAELDDLAETSPDLAATAAAAATRDNVIGAGQPGTAHAGSAGAAGSVLGLPDAARTLLDFIAVYEAPRGYDTIYGNHQDQLPKRLTEMKLAEVIRSGPQWKRAFRSSACGRYQFMTGTLETLVKSEKLSGNEVFDIELQDRLGYALLRRRGFAKYMDGRLDRNGFGLALAKEWASFPVLTDCRGSHRTVRRGETFYAGDGLNKALVPPDKVEAILDQIR